MAEFGSLVTFDKRFNGVDKSLQTRIASFYHVSAEELKSFAVEDGDVKLLSTGQFDGFTTENIAGDVINSGEVICIPTGGAANLKYYKGKFVDSGNILAVAKNDTVCLKYVFYGLKYKKAEVDFYFRGASIKHPQMADIWKITIPTKPTEIQQSVVQELDTINEVLSKKREQLKELDKFAQSIFYDMFGDPITNEKGWEVKKLGEVSTLINGRAYSQSELLDRGTYRILRVGNFFTNDSWYYSDLELDKDKYCEKGDLLFTWSASFGARIWEGEKVIFHYHIWKVLFNELWLNKIFYCYLLNYMTEAMMKDTHGTGMVHLTKGGMEQYYLPLPPLSLQQAFAEKIEKIEQMKENLRVSIKETETLLASRMSYYFE